MATVIKAGETTTALKEIEFWLLDASGNPITGASPTGRVKKNGVEDVAGGSFTEYSSSNWPGLYIYVPHDDEIVNVGPGLLFPSATGAVAAAWPFDVTPNGIYATPATTADIADKMIGRNVAGGADGGDTTVGDALVGKLKYTPDGTDAYTVKSLNGLTTHVSGSYVVNEDGTLVLTPA